MSRASTAVFPKVRRVLAELGENVRQWRKEAKATGISRSEQVRTAGAFALTDS